MRLGLSGPSWVVILLLGAQLSCDRAAPRGRRVEQLETVEVGAAADAELSTELDERARPRSESLAGVLPSDFPPDLPLPSPASIVDFGRLGNQQSFVTIDTSVPAQRATSSLLTQLERAGWSAASTDGQATVYAKADRRVRIAVESLQAGARIRYEY